MKINKKRPELAHFFKKKSVYHIMERKDDYYFNSFQRKIFALSNILGLFKWYSWLIIAILAKSNYLKKYLGSLMIRELAQYLGL